VRARSDVAARAGAPIALLMTETFGIRLVPSLATASEVGPARSVRRRSYHRRHPSDREVAVMTDMTEAHELLLIEEADAWFEYLEATRGQSELRYADVEPWAWARLRQRLRAVKTRRAKLRPAAA
jgi:hypothetical protein